MLLILSSIINNGISAKTNNKLNECKGADVESKYLQLKQTLLCNYDKNTRPRYNDANNNVTQIKLGINPQLVQYVK